MLHWRITYNFQFLFFAVHNKQNKNNNKLLFTVIEIKANLAHAQLHLDKIKTEHTHFVNKFLLILN